MFVPGEEERRPGVLPDARGTLLSPAERQWTLPRPDRRPGRPPHIPGQRGNPPAGTVARGSDSPPAGTDPCPMSRTTILTEPTDNPPTSTDAVAQPLGQGRPRIRTAAQRLATSRDPRHQAPWTSTRPARARLSITGMNLAARHRRSLAGRHRHTTGTRETFGPARSPRGETHGHEPGRSAPPFTGRSAPPCTGLSAPPFTGRLARRALAGRHRHTTATGETLASGERPGDPGNPRVRAKPWGLRLTAMNLAAQHRHALAGRHRRTTGTRETFGSAGSPRHPGTTPNMGRLTGRDG